MSHPGSDHPTNPSEQPPQFPPPAEPYAAPLPPYVPAQPSYGEPPAPPAPPAPTYAQPAPPPAYPQPTPPVQPVQPVQPLTATQPQPLAQPQPPAGPVPAAPTYDPGAMAAAQQFSAPPVSGPYGYGYYPPASALPAPPAGRSRLAIVMTALAVVFLLVAGVFTTMFFLKNQEANKLDGQVAQLTAESNDQKSKIESLNKDLSSAKRDLVDADSDLDDMTTQKKALADCLNSVYDFNRAATAANNVLTPEVQAKLDEVDRLCTIADKYL